MFSFKGIGVKIFAAILAVVMLIAGVYLTFFHSKGFVRTQATIIALEEIPSQSGDGKSPSYRATVTIQVNGTDYTGVLDTESPSYAVGRTVSVLYDPNHPAVIHGDSAMGLYAMGVGAAILAVLIISEARKKKALKAINSVQKALGEEGYPPSKPGAERKLYFLTDLGTAKAGHCIEDANRKILYEAKMTKLTLTEPYGFDLIDHEHGRSAPHLIGHEEASEWDNSLLFDNHYTFTYDGEDIWKHLRRNGISVAPSLTEGARVAYQILRDGKEIAMATGCSPNVHEEDEEAKSKLSSLVPVQGFYRITTTETDLSLLFVTLLAFARSGASDDHGGTRRVLWNAARKL